MSFRDNSKDDSQAFMDVFGETAGFGASSLTVIFDPASMMIDEQTGEVINDEPRAIARSADVTSLGLKPGDTLIIDSANYKIKATPEDDGYGMTTLRLNKI